MFTYSFLLWSSSKATKKWVRISGMLSVHTIKIAFISLFLYTEGIFKADLDDKTFIFRCEEITDTICCYYLFSVSISKLSLSLSQFLCITYSFICSFIQQRLWDGLTLYWVVLGPQSLIRTIPTIPLNYGPISLISSQQNFSMEIYSLLRPQSHNLFGLPETSMLSNPVVIPLS